MEKICYVFWDLLAYDKHVHDLVSYCASNVQLVHMN